jgi:hypothetical protein
LVVRLKVVTARAGSVTDGLLQPFLRLTEVMLEIQSEQVVRSIVLISVLRLLIGFEQSRGLATVKDVYSSGQVELEEVHEMHGQRLALTSNRLNDMLK